MDLLKTRERFNEYLDEIVVYFLKRAQRFINEVGDIFIFGVEAVKLFFSYPFRFHELVTHLEFAGNKSVFIICLTGLFTGMALSLQIYLGFKMVNATSLVGSTVALGITRELGPVLTGLIISARAGGAMAARLGSMRVSEQIDALEVMGVDPKQYLVSPRVIACAIATPLLCGLFDFLAIFGSYFLCIHLLEMDSATFFDHIRQWLEPRFIFEGLFKSAVFGLVFGVICTHRGYFTKGGAAGVGESTNQGVVTSMVMVIILDFFLSNLITIFYHAFKIGKVCANSPTSQHLRQQLRSPIS